MGRHKAIAGPRRLPLDRSTALGAKGRTGGEGGSAVHAVSGWRRSLGGRFCVRWSRRPSRGRHCCIRRVWRARSVPRIQGGWRFRDPTAFRDDEDQSDDEERHTDAEEREEDDPDDGEDRADHEQQCARGKLLRQVCPSEIRTKERTCAVKTFSSPSTRPSSGVRMFESGCRTGCFPPRFDMV